MKSKKVNQKLTLNKNTVAHLAIEDMKSFRGGLYSLPEQDTCVLSMRICTYTIPITYTLCHPDTMC